MLDHVSIGVRDLAAAKSFYDKVLGTLGYSCLYGDDGSLGYGAAAPAFWVLKVASPVKADMQSGLHFSFVAPSAAAVDAFHATALAAGAKDNGPPGKRPDYSAGYYAAFVIDPEGYRIEAHFEA